MTYDPQPGDLFVCRVPSRWSWWIEVGEWLNGDGIGKGDHAGVLLPGGLIAESSPWKARIRPLAECGYQDLVWSGPLLQPTPAQRQGTIDAARWLVERPGGTKYSILGYEALALHRAHIPAPHLRAYIKDHGHCFCSQFADLAANLGDWHLFDDSRWEGDVTPMDLRHLFRGEPVT